MGPAPSDLPALGFGLPIAGPWATPATMRDVAARAEALGYTTLWAFQRLLRPVDGTPLEPEHDAVLDPVVALAHVAACTSTIRLGTATICAPFTAPVLLAKALASLDVVCEGRLTVGVGMGWVPEEHVATGTPQTGRGKRFEEYLRCLVALWTRDPAEFHGEQYVVPRAHLRPRPVQRPHPPLLVGGTAEAALDRAGRLADGGLASSKQDPDTLRRAIATVRAGAASVGRDPDAVRVLVRLAPGTDLRPRDEVLEHLAHLKALGVTEAFVDCNLSPRVGRPDADPAEVLEHALGVLEAYAPGAS